jgi:hypothetical protein
MFLHIYHSPKKKKGRKIVDFLARGHVGKGIPQTARNTFEQPPKV